MCELFLRALCPLANGIDILSHSFALVPQYVGYELNASASAFSKPQAARPEKLEAVNSSCDDYLGAGNACRRKRQCLKLLADRQ